MKTGKDLIIWCITIMLLVVSLPLSTRAAAGAGEGQTLRVGYVGAEEFISKDEMGVMRGYGVAYLERISRYTGWDYEYVFETRENALKRLEEGDIDLMCSVQRTEEREQVLDFSRFPIGTENSVLYTLSENTDIAFRDYEAMDGKTIAMIEGSYQSIKLKEYADQKGFSYKALNCPSSKSVKKALEKGESQIALLGTLDSHPGFKIIDRYDPAPYYIATTKGNTEILTLLNEALEDINAVSPNLNFQLYNEYQYGGKCSELPLFTKEELAYRSENHKIRVACVDGYYPLTFANEKTGEPDGVFPTILKEISRRSGIELQLILVPIEKTAEDMLKKKEVDAISSIMYSQGLAQQDNIQHSEAYFNSSIVLVAQSGIDLSKIEEMEVALPRVYETLVSYDTSMNGISSRILYKETAEECLEAVRKGEADFTVQNSYIANYYLQSAKYENIAIVASDILREKNCMLFDGNMDPTAISVIDKTIQTLSEEETGGTISSYVRKNPYEQSLMDFWYAHGGTVLLIGAVMVIALAIIIALNRRRTKALLQLQENEAYRAVTERDSLTGLYSRQAFYDRVRKTLDIDENAKTPYEIMYFNVEKFKIINELFGVKGGDLLIRYIADCIRKWAEGHDAVCARFEADHFLVFTERDEEAASEIMSIIYKQLDEFQSHMQIDISCGIYYINEPKRSVNLMCDRAHLAVDSIKGRHFQNIAIYDDSHRSRMIQEQMILNDMENALQQEQFHVYLQPKYNMKTEEIVGAEALVRWIHPSRGIISPGEFIPVFEHNGFISRLDMYMFRKTCVLLRKWADEGKKLYPVSVNLSRANFYNRNLCSNLCDIAGEYKIPRKYLQLEIVETAYANDMEIMGTRMLELQKAGFTILMDDFGSGYSSFNMLKDAPIDVVKLDMSFLSISDPYGRGESILEMVIGLGNRLNLPVLAEGVESKKHADMLLGYGCYLAQGYYYSRPVPVEEYEELLYGHNN